MAEIQRHLTEKRKNKISWHIQDLLGRDINVAYDCTVWLQPNQRDIARNARPKRHAARYIAACMVVESVQNPAFAKEVLDRTEGKVADKLITVDYNDLIQQLEAARQRVLSHRQGSDTPQQVVGEQVDNPNRLCGLHIGSYQTLVPGDGQVEANQVATGTPVDHRRVPSPGSETQASTQTQEGVKEGEKTEVVGSPTGVGE